jgi:hypothetical protein
MSIEIKFKELVKNIASSAQDLMQFVEQLEPNTMICKNTTLLHMLFMLRSSKPAHEILINKMIKTVLQKVSVLTYNDVYESIMWISKNNIVFNYKAEEFTIEQREKMTKLAIVTKNMNLLLYNDLFDTKEYNKRLEKNLLISVKKMTHPVIVSIYCLQINDLSFSDIIEEFVIFSDYV